MILIYAQIKITTGAKEVLNPKNYVKAAGNIVRELTKMAEQGCWLEAPVYGGERPGGTLVKSIHGKFSRKNLEGKVVSTAPYVFYVIYGTKPHKIEGNPMLWLENYHIWVKSVMHPGMAPNDFPSRAVSRFLTATFINAVVGQALNWLENGGRQSLKIGQRDAFTARSLHLKQSLDYIQGTDYIGYTLDKSGGSLKHE